MLFGESSLGLALAGTAFILGVATLYSLSTNPMLDFDVDLYLSINKSLFGPVSGSGLSSAGVLGGGGLGGEIVELPALSPAEQIVGAFFGPPHTK